MQSLITTVGRWGWSYYTASSSRINFEGSSLLPSWSYDEGRYYFAEQIIEPRPRGFLIIDDHRIRYHPVLHHVDLTVNGQAVVISPEEISITVNPRITVVIHLDDQSFTADIMTDHISGVDFVVHRDGLFERSDVLLEPVTTFPHRVYDPEAFSFTIYDDRLRPLFSRSLTEKDSVIDLLTMEYHDAINGIPHQGMATMGSH